jgi:acetoin utilization deacetylase AcuC-like enzyme
MITIFSEDNRAHGGKKEWFRGSMVDCFESPLRADIILSRIQEIGLGMVIPPSDFGLQPILRVHDSAYVDFLQTIYSQWSSAHIDTDALPHVWSCRTLRQIVPESMYGKLGFYSFDSATPITNGTWRAALAAANVALTGQKLLGEGHSVIFALTRPPGHHAGRDIYGGYCYLNNAAIAAQALIDSGAQRVAILDVDYHHGNGTQSIFYDRDDVLFVSIHADPSQAYPYFLGYSDECGSGSGKGFNLNIPLREGATWEEYRAALAEGIRRVVQFRPDALVVSLGVDTFQGDPISLFKLERDHFTQLGSHLSGVGVPTLFVMEGGYATEALGVNVANVLQGFEGSRSSP